MLVPNQLNPKFSAAPTTSGHNPLEEAQKRLIVALDTPDAASALTLVDRLQNTIQWFKIGLELFTSEGYIVTETLLRKNYSVFLDLKLHDIPNTVAGAVRSAAKLGVQMLTVHASGGPAMLAAAQEAALCSNNPMQLLAVTVLTSMDKDQLHAIGIQREPAHQVELLAAIGKQAGISGFVCSAQEAAALRAHTGPSSTLVVPGIRPSGADSDDQKRVATPAEALHAGASYLVVGRPITQAADPAQAATAILKEMTGALRS